MASHGTILVKLSTRQIYYTLSMEVIEFTKEDVHLDNFSPYHMHYAAACLHIYYACMPHNIQHHLLLVRVLQLPSQIPHSTATVNITA